MRGGISDFHHVLDLCRPAAAVQCGSISGEMGALFPEVSPRRRSGLTQPDAVLGFHHYHFSPLTLSITTYGETNMIQQLPPWLPAACADI